MTQALKECNSVLPQGQFIAEGKWIMKRVVDEQNYKHQLQSHTWSAEEMKQIIDLSISLFCVKMFMYMLIKAFPPHSFLYDLT